MLAAVLTVTLAVGGGALLWRLTAGFTLFTSESWRRAEVETSPRPLPSAHLQDERGRALNLRELCGKVLVVDFVYTRCETICRGVGSVSSQLAQRLADPIRSGQVEVISLSFDPQRDEPEQLREFKRVNESRPSAWRLARPLEPAASAELLDRFGIIVIDDGIGGFEHNAALHVVDRQCRLAQVFDVDAVDRAEKAVRARL